MNAMLQKTIGLARQSSAIRQSLVLSFSTVFTGVIMGISFILLSRVMGPDQFGIFSVSLALLGIYSRVPDLGLNQVMIKMLGNWRDNPAKIREFLGQVLRWKLQLSIILIVGSIFSIPLLTNWLSYPHPDILFVTLLGALVLVLYEYVYVVLSAEHRFTTVALLGVSQAILKFTGFSLCIVLGLTTVLPISVVYFLSPLLSAGVIFWMYRNVSWAPLRQASLSIIQQIKPFARHAALGAVAMTLIANIDVLFVQSQLTPFDTGIYSGASRIAVFVGFVSSAVGGVLNNRAARYRDKETLLMYMKKSLSVVLLAVVGFLLFIPFAYQIIFYTIGAEYLSGVTALILLVLNAFLSFALVPYIAVFYSLDRPSYFSIGGVIQASVIILGSFFFLKEYGIEAAAWSRLMATILFMLYTIYILVREFRSFEK